MPVSNDQESISSLEKALRDGAGIHADRRRAAVQAEHAEAWQDRLDELAERVEQLEAERSRSFPVRLRSRTVRKHPTSVRTGRVTRVAVSFGYPMGSRGA